MDKKKETTTKKHKSWSFIILILVDIIAIAFFAIYFLNLRYNILSRIDYRSAKYDIPSVYYFKDKSIGLEKILVRVFLFEPKGERFVGVYDWQRDLKAIFNKIQLTHSQQFFNLSNLDYVVYPEIIYGNFSREYYDGEGLQIRPGEDERQLNLIMDEINERIESGELDKINFKGYKYDFLVNQIFYTGSNKFDSSEVVVAGYTNEKTNKNSSLIFWSVLNGQDIHSGASIVYHEILHTLGVPEGYTYDDFAPFVDDIMGMGVITNRPIEINFLSHEFKKEMGL